MKTARIILLAFITQCSKLYGNDVVPFTAEELEVIAHLNINDIPRHIRIHLLKEKKTQKDDSHVCCATDQSLNVPSHTETHIGTKEIIVATKVNHGSHGCGLFGLSHCDNGQDLQYSAKLVTYIEYKTVPDPSVCPDKHIICCNNYIMVAEQCYNLTYVVDHQDFFKAVAQGIFKPHLLG